MSQNMIYTNNEGLKEERHKTSCDCDAYLGDSKQKAEGHPETPGRVYLITMITSASRCRVDVHHIHRTTLRA